MKVLKGATESVGFYKLSEQGLLRSTARAFPFGFLSKPTYTLNLFKLKTFSFNDTINKVHQKEMLPKNRKLKKYF